MLRGFKTTFKRQSSIAASNKNKDNIKLFLYLNFRVVMRRSRCRPWLDCGRCVRSLRTRIYRRSTRLMDKSQRLINLNTQAKAQATLEQSKIQNEYKSQPLCTSTAANNSIQCFSLYTLSSRTQLNIIRSHCTMYSQVYSINHIKANLDHAITPLQNEQPR